MGQKAKHDYSPRVRRALFEGLLAAAKAKDMTLSEYCQHWWEEDWKAAGSLLTKFLPKEHNIKGRVNHEHHHTHEGLSSTLAFIEGVVGGEEEGALEEPVQTQPLLPSPVHAKQAGR